MAYIGADDVLRAMGLSSKADELTRREAAEAAARIEAAARPRSVWKLLPLRREGGELFVGNVLLRGRDIARHLERCSECAALCVTLGLETDRFVRAAEAESVSLASALDCAASALCEAECEALEREIRARLAPLGRFVTSRYSPGYGDLPIETNIGLALELNAQRAAGVTASESGALLPRKSVIALCGVSNAPVSGALAGCESCALREKCDETKGGRLCER